MLKSPGCPTLHTQSTSFRYIGACKDAECVRIGSLQYDQYGAQHGGNGEHIELNAQISLAVDAMQHCVEQPPEDEVEKLKKQINDLTDEVKEELARCKEEMKKLEKRQPPEDEKKQPPEPEDEKKQPPEDEKKQPPEDEKEQPPETEEPKKKKGKKQPPEDEKPAEAQVETKGDGLTTDAKQGSWIAEITEFARKKEIIG